MGGFRGNACYTGVTALAAEVRSARHLHWIGPPAALPKRINYPSCGQARHLALLEPLAERRKVLPAFLCLREVVMNASLALVDLTQNGAAARIGASHSDGMSAILRDRFL